MFNSAAVTVSTPTANITKTLILGGTSTVDNSINGNLANAVSGGFTSTVAVTKYGAGTWVLGGSNNTYTGLTTVAQGTLKTTSSFPSGGNVTFSNLNGFAGGSLELGGNATLGTVTTTDGANRIGAAGSLTIANLATPGDGSTLRFVPGTGNVTLTQFGGANIGVGLLSPHVFFGTGNSVIMLTHRRVGF